MLKKSVHIEIPESQPRVQYVADNLQKGFPLDMGSVFTGGDKGPRPIRLLAIGMAAALLATPAQALEFAVAGAPVPLVESQDYSGLFATLDANKITGFFPTFQYQEIPTAEGFGYESDFTAPCSPTDPAFSALRASKVKLIIPAEVIYPDPEGLSSVSLANDPLTQLITCAGRENILGVSNYDEAVYQGVSKDAVRAAFERVKAVDPTMPVMMVHGPLVMDMPQFSSRYKRQRYLKNVVEYSAYADIVGFDTYPIPDVLAKLATPLSNGQIATADVAIVEYLQWLTDELPEKRKLMVYQGFAMKDMWEPNLLNENVPQELQDLARAPNREELDEMINAAKAFGVETVFWWGQGALREQSQAPWPDILDIAKQEKQDTTCQ